MVVFYILDALLLLSFLSLGVAFMMGKGDRFIAGLNGMSDAGRGRFNRKKVMRFVGFELIIVTVLITLIISFVRLSWVLLPIILGIILICTVAIGLVIVNVSKYFQN